MASARAKHAPVFNPIETTGAAFKRGCTVGASKRFAFGARAANIDTFLATEHVRTHTRARCRASPLQALRIGQVHSLAYRTFALNHGRIVAQKAGEAITIGEARLRWWGGLSDEALETYLSDETVPTAETPLAGQLSFL